MKKYVWLVLGTGLAVALVFGVRAAVIKEPVAVMLVTIEPQTVRQTVACTGKIEAADGQAVYADAPCVAGTVLVKEGQTVKKGEVLFTVDTEATQQALSQLAPSLSGVTGLTKTQITAPVSGVITSLNVKSGEVVQQDEACAVIASGDDVQIAVSIRERYLPQVSVGQAATVTGVAFPGTTYTGTVKTLAKTAHQKYIGTVSETVVDAVIALTKGADDPRLKAGLNAKVSIVTGEMKDVLLIPYECLAQTDEGKEFVYVYQENGTAYQRFVETDGEYADGVLVVSGLSAGERLVQNPEVLSGDRVRVQEG